MKPAHLQRHLKTKHPSYVGKEPEFFKRKLSDSTASAKSLEASYAVSLLIAKAKKPFTKGEDLLLPAAVVLAEMMLDKNAAEKFKTVPLSNVRLLQSRQNGNRPCRSSCSKTRQLVFPTVG
ncbi:Zinc finger MYM-type protein 6 [Merluccius polli]|uniref:Zinc finger MYM-type protein 6 n=1 Tax=Merluccius polli TaxID=89951 RepID=A0AA47P4N6_MERPO|nr:Zinc finger MYM-type protein 6 [Merluccius polli]